MKQRTLTILVGLLSIVALLPSASAQTCSKAISATTPDAAFIIHGDGTATHLATGLMWMRCSLGQVWNDEACGGAATSFSWGSALQAADGHSFAGYSDWRLPNKNELESIVEESCFSPAINARVFPAAPSAYFWSSSPYSGSGTGAWSVDFGYGPINASVKNGSLAVRLVRGNP